MSQTNKLCEEELKKLNEEFKKSDQNRQPLDDFDFKEVGIQMYIPLSFVLRLAFTLNHGQAAVERGFRINKSIISQNMKPESFTARMLIKNHILPNNLKPQTILIDRPLISSVKSAYQRYRYHLQEI